MECVFCQIVDGKVPSEILYRDEEVIAFRDINPEAPVHILIIPKKHIPSLAHLPKEQSSLIGHMANIANQLAKKEGISEKGYRLVINCGEQGGQLVPHLHIHLLGGKKLPNSLS